MILKTLVNGGYNPTYNWGCPLKIPISTAFPPSRAELAPQMLLGRSTQMSPNDTGHGPSLHATLAHIPPKRLGQGRLLRSKMIVWPPNMTDLSGKNGGWSSERWSLPAKMVDFNGRCAKTAAIVVPTNANEGYDQFLRYTLCFLFT